MFMDITGIDLFNRNVGLTFAEVRFRSPWISLVLIYLIKMKVRHVLRLDADVPRYHWY